MYIAFPENRTRNSYIDFLIFGHVTKIQRSYLVIFLNFVVEGYKGGHQPLLVIVG